MQRTVALPNEYVAAADHVREVWYLAVRNRGRIKGQLNALSAEAALTIQGNTTSALLRSLSDSAAAYSLFATSALPLRESKVNLSPPRFDLVGRSIALAEEID